MIDMEKIIKKIKCTHCAKTFSFEINEEDERKFLNKEVMLQDAFPYLAPWEREMFLTGLCRFCWDDLFKGYENSEDEDDEE